MHISSDEMNRLINGGLSFEEQERILEHIGECSECAQQFAEYMEESIKEPSRGFSENVEYKLNEAKRELFFYSLRVAAAVAASLAIVFSVSFPEAFEAAEKSRAKFVEKTEIVLQEINNNFNGGNLSYENKKK